MRLIYLTLLGDIMTGPNISASQPQQEKKDKKNKGEPFLMYLRTALWDRLKQRGNGTYWILGGVDPLAEDPFEVYVAGTVHGIRITHNKVSTSFEILDDSLESFKILEDAIDSLKEANRHKPTLDGAPRETHYELTFDLHIENESQLITMISFADTAGLEITNYYHNGVLIDPERIIKAREDAAKATPRSSDGPINEDLDNDDSSEPLIEELPEATRFQSKRSPFPALEHKVKNPNEDFWHRWDRLR